MRMNMTSRLVSLTGGPPLTKYLKRGQESLFSNTLGFNNTAIGREALRSSVDAVYHNVSIL